MGGFPFVARAAAAAPPFATAPFKIAGGHIYIGVTVKGIPVDAVFDTGASSSVIDEGLAAKLNITAVKKEQAQFIYGKGEVGLSEPVDVGVGHITLKPQLYITKLRNAGSQIDMLLGQDVMAQIILGIDPERRRALVIPRGNFKISSARKLSLRQDDKMLTMDLNLDGRAVTAMIDTGDATSVSVHSDWAKRTGFLDGKRTASWGAFDLSGQHPVTRTSATILELGGFNFHNVPTNVHDSQLKYPVTIGAEVFTHLFCIWDIGALTLWLPERQPRLGAPFVRDRSGLASLPDGEALKVVIVAFGSPAAKAGWKVGDRIALINGKPYKDLVDYTAWKEDPSQKTAALTMDSGEVRVLELADYY